MEYLSGYRRPPVHSQFKKGQSGNNKGRPKASASFKADVAEELGETIAISGSAAPVTKRRAIVKQLVAASIAGDTKATSTLINICAKLFRDDEDADPRAAEDEAFVEKLAERERQAESPIDPTASTVVEDLKNE